MPLRSLQRENNPRNADRQTTFCANCGCEGVDLPLPGRAGAPVHRIPHHGDKPGLVVLNFARCEDVSSKRRPTVIASSGATGQALPARVPSLGGRHGQAELRPWHPLLKGSETRLVKFENLTSNFHHQVTKNSWCLGDLVVKSPSAIMKELKLNEYKSQDLDFPPLGQVESARGGSVGERVAMLNACPSPYGPFGGIPALFRIPENR
jgi:hypothetical protein